MNNIFLSPPIVILILILLGLAIFYVATAWSFGKKETKRKTEAYACGRRDIDHNSSPDYRGYYPLAFFYALLLIIILIMATTISQTSVTLPLLYVAAGAMILLIIFRR